MSEMSVSGGRPAIGGSGAFESRRAVGSEPAGELRSAPGAVDRAPESPASCDPATGVCNIERALAQQTDRPGLKQDMLNYLSGLEYEFGVLYAPAEHKGELHGWDLQRSFAEARKEVQALTPLTVEGFQKILKRLVATARDYHVSVNFHSSARSTLPLSISGADEEGVRKYFITHIDRERLDSRSFPYEPGIEVTHFDGTPLGDVVKELMDLSGHAVELTDRALAEFALTKRSGVRGMDTPDRPIILTLRDATGREFEHQLAWNHYQESARTPKELGGETLKPHMISRSGRPTKNAAALVMDASANDMQLPSWDARFEAASDPHGLGARRSFLPRLGEPVEEADADDLFDWYIYENDDGKRIGVLRIPSYTPEDAEASVARFAEITRKMQERTDGLVLDQHNNPGGSVFYLYALASLLTDKPLPTPKHEMKITQAEVMRAKQLVDTTEALKSAEKSGALTRAIFGETVQGYPVGSQFAHFINDYARFILGEFEAGKSMTGPSHIFGVDQINPYPDVDARYTKPILFLANERCFSGGDFMPAILQDAGRATIMGNRTAGAGGYVSGIESANLLGVRSISVTGSLAMRASQRRIEDLGVEPDVVHAPTAADLRNGYADYAKGIDEQMKKLVAQSRFEPVEPSEWEKKEDEADATKDTSAVETATKAGKRADAEDAANEDEEKATRRQRG